MISEKIKLIRSMYLLTFIEHVNEAIAEGYIEIGNLIVNDEPSYNVIVSKPKQKNPFVEDIPNPNK